MLSNQRHKVYPGSGRGPYVEQWCARGTILLSTGEPVVGRLQARRERRRGLQVPGEVAEDVVGELRSVWVVRQMLSVVFCLLVCVPCDGGVHLPLIGQGEGELHACHTIQLHGEVLCAAR
jgi:hypothetical protein